MKWFPILVKNSNKIDPTILIYTCFVRLFVLYKTVTVVYIFTTYVAYILITLEVRIPFVCPIAGQM